MNVPVQVSGILERSGADAGASEGTQAWALALVNAAFVELHDAATELDDNLASIAKSGIRVPLSTRQATARLHAALARIDQPLDPDSDPDHRAMLRDSIRQVPT